MHVTSKPNPDSSQAAAPPRPGYTLLELMLALALLGALLTVAWSLMGTYRDAEQKGWQLTMRTQTVRAIHDWLQQDIDHVQGPADEADRPRLPTLSGQSETLRGPRPFAGTKLGFTVTIQPSLAPLPFLERLMSAADAPQVDELAAISSGDVALAPTLWSDMPLQVEYRLIPTAGSQADNAPASPANPSLEGEDLYLLSRTARRNAAELGQAWAATATSTSSSAADRVLTAQDLYRQTDEQTSPSLGPLVEESVLHGLVNARFRYFDGRNWQNEWTPSSPHALPQAVALSFDLPRRFEPTVTSVPRPPSDALEDDSTLERNSNANALNFADAALASETLAEIDDASELSLVENESHQVHIVVRLSASSDGANSAVHSPTLGSGL